MVEPEKPFACSIQGCGMTFTNEDHLHVHTKKHDMVLQFGMEQKAAFVGKFWFLLQNSMISSVISKAAKKPPMDS